MQGPQSSLVHHCMPFQSANTVFGKDKYEYSSDKSWPDEVTTIIQVEEISYIQRPYLCTKLMEYIVLEKKCGIIGIVNILTLYQLRVWKKLAFLAFLEDDM